MEPTQDILLEIPEQPVQPKPTLPAVETSTPTLKLKPIDRNQTLLRMLAVDELVRPDHKVRAMWELTGQFDLAAFQGKLKSVEGKAGRAAWDPRLLLSTWMYAYSEGVTSARAVSDLMEYEPGLMWLSGLGEVNYHTLSDFRAANQEGLKKALAELLGMLSAEGFVKLERVAHDGAKIRAQGGGDTFRREATLEKEIEKAKQMVEELEKEGEEGSNRRREAAMRRAAQERSERLKRAKEELERIQASKKEEEKQAARVSLSEPEARMMKHGDGGIAPSYNVQLSTDVESKIIVGMHLTQDSSDSGSLLPGMEEVKQTAGSYPAEAVADGGFTNRESIGQMKELGIEFYGSLAELAVKQGAAMKAAGIDPAFGPARFEVKENKTLVCAAGVSLEYVRQSTKREILYHQYQVKGGECLACKYQKQCCPRTPEEGRLVSIRMSEHEIVAEFREKMKSEEARKIYRQRGAVAEFPNCWIKEKLGVRKFRLRGKAKATTEAWWAVLTYDVMQWVRLIWRPKYVCATETVAAAA